MPRIKKPKNAEAATEIAAESCGEEVKIKVQDKSSLAEFTKRPLPTDKELENFEEYVEEEVKEEEVRESLSEIYQDDKGELVDVKKLDIKKKRGFFYWFFTIIFSLAILGGTAYAAYFYLQGGTDPTKFSFSIQGKDKVLAGEEFVAAVDYKNESNSDVDNVKIKLIYPENFVFIESYPAANEKNDAWVIDKILAKQGGKIEIKGKIIGQPGSSNIFLGNINYYPANFSSEFKKEASFSAEVSDIGLNTAFVNGASALVGEKNEIEFKFMPQEKNFISDFRLTAEPLENMEFIAAKDDKENIKNTKPGVWEVGSLTQEEQIINIGFKFNKKIADTQDVKLILEQKDSAGNYRKFFEKVFSYEIVKSDLSLSLIINGSKNDQGIDFGQTLNYSIVYANKGANEMKDVVIMAAVDSDLINWNSIVDKNNGAISGNTISWSKEEIPELEVLQPSQEGTIDFSLKVKDFGKPEVGKVYQVSSFAQFNVGSGLSVNSASDNKSNTIINKINSDLKFSEQIKYFNDDNIAVGSGPLPPKAGERTSYKVYWTITNNLHELKNLQVETVLPDYAEWDSKNIASVGTIYYDGSSRKVIWQIGNLPLSAYNIDAEFNIAITPSDSQKNQVIVLLAGSSAQAVDSATESPINITNKPKTTKLEDDEIANSDGRVE